MSSPSTRMRGVSPVHLFLYPSMGVANTFYLWGFIFLVFVTGAAQFYKNPPAGRLPAGFTPAAGSGSSDAGSLSFAEAKKTPQWWMMWSMLFLNVTEGIGLISQLSPIGQELSTATGDIEQGPGRKSRAFLF